MTLKLKIVSGRREMKTFLNLPRRLYTETLKDERFVMPFVALTKMLLGKLQSPKSEALLVYAGDEAVARMAYKVHSANGKTKVHFGFFECFPGQAEAAQLMIRYIREKHPELKLMGPFNFRSEDPFVGTLIDGFEFEPYFLMAYNPPYYGEYLESCGLSMAMDVLAYDVVSTTELPQDMREKSEECQLKGFTIRYMTKKGMKEDVRSIARIFNDALSNNWEFEEMPDSQIQELYLMIKFFVDPDLVSFVQKDGRDVGCLINIPNYNPIFKKFNGRIGPRLLWDLYRSKGRMTSIRCYALGVLKEFHGQGLASFLVNKTWIRGTQEKGYKTAEISWVLANNDPMNNLTAKLDGKPNRRYRIFEAPPLAEVQAP